MTQIKIHQTDRAWLYTRGDAAPVELDGFAARVAEAIRGGMPWPDGGALALAESIGYEAGDKVSIACLGYDGEETEAVRGLEVEFGAVSSLASQNLIRFEAREFDTPTALEDFAKSLGAEISQDWQAGTTTVVFSDGSKLVNEGPDWSVTI